MIKNIGRFQAYVPDRAPIDILLGVLSFLRKGTKFVLDPLEAQRFFFQLKQQYPEFFEDIYFTSDPEFPYSEEIQEAITRLQNSGFVIRPNPTFYKFELGANIDINNLGFSSEDLPVFSSIADSFSSHFVEPN